MITCDRCGHKILFPQESFNPLDLFEIVDNERGLIACIQCDNEYRVGLKKIKEELGAELKHRSINWCNEWRRNFKPEK